MRTAMMALVACGWVVASGATAQEPETKDRPPLVVREIDLTGFRGEAKGDPFKPTPISNRAELAQAIPDKEWQDRINKQVDFGRQQLLFFAWSGSSGDALSYKAGPVFVFFFYKMGMPRDNVPHFHLYALPRGARWGVLKEGDAPDRDQE